MSVTVEVPKAAQGKSGFLSSEFLKSAVVDVLALLTMVGEIKPTGNPKYDSIISAAAGLAAAANNIGYASSRGKVKAAKVQVAGDIVNVAQHNAAQMGRPSPVVVDNVQPSYVADDGGV